MASPTSHCNVTFIGTATAILEVDGVHFITDPVFSPAGTSWNVGPVVLENTNNPAMGLQDVPVIDAVLLSHDDHPDNLDELGRRLLDGRRVLTTMDGAKNLAPRPGVTGLRPWETISLDAGGKHFQVTGTPCVHLPGGECIGFILRADGFGVTNGLPNAIYFSGDTIYIEELAEMRKRFHITVAILNIGRAMAPGGSEPLQITMDGKQAARLFRDIDADVLIPMHYEGWNHFSEDRQRLTEEFNKEGIQDKVLWLTPGVSKSV